VSARGEVEEQFGATGDSEFFKSAEEIVLDGVLAEAKLRRDAFVGLATGRALHDLEFTVGQGGRVSGAERGQGRDAPNGFEQGIGFMASGPDEAICDVLDAGQELSHGALAGENSASSGAKSVENDLPSRLV
jgi:hypothetical protein